MTRTALSTALLALSCLLGACADDAGTSSPVGATDEKAASGDQNNAKAAQGDPTKEKVASGDPTTKTTPVAPVASCPAGDLRGCHTADGLDGQQACAADSDGTTAWGACEALPCDPGEVSDCTLANESKGARVCDFSGSWSQCGKLGCHPGEKQLCGGMAGEMGVWMSCSLEGDTWAFSSISCATPLVISFDGARVEFSQASGSFDVQGAGVCAATDWVTAATPWLALDRDGNGRIDDGAELFGSMTRLPGGERAKQGFEALAPLDSDGDGRITAADEAWSRLVLWSDTNQDRVSQPGELHGLDAEGIVEISLGYRLVPRCEVGGSCEGERAGVRWHDRGGRERQGAVIDVRLASR